MEYSNDMQNVYKNIKKYNIGKKYKILIVFDDMIADLINNKKTKSNCNEFVYQRQKIKHFNCLYYTIIS